MFTYLYGKYILSLQPERRFMRPRNDIGKRTLLLAVLNMVLFVSQTGAFPKIIS